MNAFFLLETNACRLFIVAKMLGQKAIDFAVNATLKFKNDKAKLAATF